MCVFFIILLVAPLLNDNVFKWIHFQVIQSRQQRAKNRKMKKKIVRVSWNSHIFISKIKRWYHGNEIVRRDFYEIRAHWTKSKAFNEYLNNMYLSQKSFLEFVWNYSLLNEIERFCRILNLGTSIHLSIWKQNNKFFSREI